MASGRITNQVSYIEGAIVRRLKCRSGMCWFRSFMKSTAGIFFVKNIVFMPVAMESNVFTVI